MADVSNPIRRTRSDYENLLAEHGRSGLSLRAFAESKGIKPPTFYSWHRRLRPRGSAPAGSEPRLIPVRVVRGDDGHAPARADRPPPSFDITIPGDRVVSVPFGFDAQELRRLLDVLGAAAC